MKESSDGEVQCCSVDSSSIINHIKLSARAGFRTKAELSKVRGCGGAQISWRRTSHLEVDLSQLKQMKFTLCMILHQSCP